MVAESRLRVVEIFSEGVEEISQPHDIHGVHDKDPTSLVQILEDLVTHVVEEVEESHRVGVPDRQGSLLRVLFEPRVEDTTVGPEEVGAW